jgi:pyruvate dehydrogenase complex dihydrolipoamide acetyltransferase long form
MTLKFKLPDIGEGVAEGEIVAWLVAEGDPVHEDQPLCEVMTDKVTVEVPSPQSGRLVKQVYPQGSVVPVGAELAWIDDGSGAEAMPPVLSEVSKPRPQLPNPNMASPTPCSLKVAPQPPPPTLQSPSPPAVPQATPLSVLAAPATRQLARTLGVDLTTVTGSGPHGRVIPADVEQAASASSAHPSNTPIPFTPSVANKAVPDKAVPYTGLRRTIGERLGTAKRTVPEFVLVEEVNVSALVALREQLKPAAIERAGVKLTYLPFVLKALGSALRVFPALNSQLVDQQIIYKGALDIGVAVEVPDGLMVPVIRQADQYSVLALAQQVDDLANRARTGKLNRQEASGSTFTVTSIGSIGGVMGIPIINPPEAAILAINRIRRAPVLTDDEQVVAGWLMNLTLTCDHRVVDGGTAARFLAHLRDQLQRPAVLLL